MYISKSFHFIFPHCVHMYANNLLKEDFLQGIVNYLLQASLFAKKLFRKSQIFTYFILQSVAVYATVKLPKPTVARWSLGKTAENRATSDDCRPTSIWIFADFLVGRRLFWQRNQVKNVTLTILHMYFCW